MSFTTYLNHNFVEACSKQRNILNDEAMLKKLANGSVDVGSVKSWMRTYGLLQGIKKKDRTSIAKCFIDFASKHSDRKQGISNTKIKSLYCDLYGELYKKVPRTWNSATSKLLWCLFPYDVVIYDSIVHDALTAMQCLDDQLSEFPRLGSAPTVKSKSDIANACAHYMNYQGMVRKLLSVHLKGIKKLKQQHNEKYRYDIRVIDKLLWMIGNPDQEFSYGSPTRQCELAESN